VKEKSPMGCSGVNSIGQTAKLHALSVKLTDQSDEVFDRSSEPIEFPND
jgi:hypothetical protein